MSNLTPFNGMLYISYQSGWSYSYDNITWTSFTMPLNLNIIQDSNILFVNPFILTDLTDYIWLNNNGSNVVIDGGIQNNHIIDISTDGYQGFIYNTSPISGDPFPNGDNVTVQNFILYYQAGTLQTGFAWLCPKDFGSGAINNVVKNCAVLNGRFGSVPDCGGIIGTFSGNYGGQLTINNCYYTGLIDQINCAGIIAPNCGNVSGTVTFNNCYSIADITGANSGGIAAPVCGDDTATIIFNNCYSIGDITSSAGGIVGYTSTNISLNNCYSTGNMFDYTAGGLVGYSCNNVNINNCYTCGSGITDPSSNGFFGSLSTNVNITNSLAECASGNSGWNGTNAANTLSSSGIWYENNLSLPFPLLSYNNSPYTVNNTSIMPGGTTNLIVNNNAGRVFAFANSEANFTIDSASGNITNTNPSVFGNNILEIFNYSTVSGNYGQYNFYNFPLNVYFPIAFSNNLYIGNDGYSTDNTNWNAFDFPVAISASGISNNLVRFVNTMDFSNFNDYFYVHSNNGTLIFDSSGSTQNISASGFNGLFQNGLANVSGLNNVTIQNFNLNCTGSLLPYGGWLCQPYFAVNSSNQILNNTSNGQISPYGGGIVGAYFGACTGLTNPGNINLINNCNSTGLIGNFAGGIAGAYADYGSDLNIVSCNSIGDIGQFAGGIVGAYATNHTVASSMTILKCYSLGNIGQFAGGIIGAYSSIIGNYNVINSYSTGGINNFAGGIVGYNNGGSDPSSNMVQNCYSQGDIASYAGGIVGAGITNTQITDCYSQGFIGSNAGGIIGSGCEAGVSASGCYTSGDASGSNSGIYSQNNVISPPTITNCYAESNNSSYGWKDLNADQYLNTNQSYFNFKNNTPFILTAFNANPFTTNITPIYAGTSAANTLAPYAYSEFANVSNTSGITVNNNGVIFVDSNVPVGPTSFILLNYQNFLKQYWLYDYIFTVANNPISNNTDFNALVSTVGNQYILNGNFSTDSALYIYLPETSIFNGNNHTITVNTPSNTTLFELRKQSSGNEKTIIENLNVIGANYISNQNNVTLFNCSYKNNNNIQYISMVGNNCGNINIYNSKYIGVGSLIGNNCYNVSIIKSYIDTVLIKNKSAAITGTKCKDVNIINTKIRVLILSRRSSGAIGYKNSNISLSHSSFRVTIKNKYCAVFVCSQSNNVKIFGNDAKVKSKRFRYRKYYLSPANRIFIKNNSIYN